MNAKTLGLLAVVALIGSAAPAGAQEDYSGAWDLLTGMAGTWASVNVETGERNVLSYHVTGGGRVVWEEFLGETPHAEREMATAYHPDGGALVATHYCGAGNQPRMRAMSYDPDSRTLRFDFWDATNVPHPDDYHTTDIELVFHDTDHVVLRFNGTQDGKESGWQSHELIRISRLHTGAGR